MILKSPEFDQEVIYCDADERLQQIKSTHFMAFIDMLNGIKKIWIFSRMSSHLKIAV